MRWLSILSVMVSLMQVGLTARVANAQLDELARYVPSSANAAAFVNVKKLMESPIAKREGWATKRDLAFGAGITMLPPDGDYAVLATQVDLEFWSPVWEAAILKLDHDPSFAKLAGATGGTLDNLAGHEAVALHGDAYVVKIGEKMAAFMSPANRQSVSRWMREVDGRREPALSPYLSEALGFADELGTPVVIALDVEDAVTEEALKKLLEESSSVEFLTQGKLDAQQVLKMLSGLRGITFGATFNEQPFGKIKVDFHENVPLTPEAAKMALLHALARRGAMLDELTEWKPAVAGKQVTLEGYLTASGMRRLSSMFDRPPSLKLPATATASTQQQPSNTKEQVVAHTSKVYFQQVEELLEDLGKERKKNSGYTMAQIGVWMDKYAKKIDQLPVLNVDPEVVDYAAQVADSLRAGYSAIRTGAARSRVRQVNTPMTYNYYSGGETYGYSYRMGLWGGMMPYGYSETWAVPDTRAYQQARTRAKTEERVSSASSARDIMAQVDQASAAIRRKMSQKYQINF